MINQVAIMGLGLMGGSLGLALRSRHPAVKVHGYTRSAARGELARQRGAVDAIHADAAAAVREADIVVLCAPILSIPDQLRSVMDALKPGALVTDVGSTKAEVQRACVDVLAGRAATFIGSHPIAGSEQQGMEAARADLYDGATVVVTPDAGTDAVRTEVVAGLWRMVGAEVAIMTPGEHDQVLALTSHLPHVMASVLAVTVGRPGLRPDLPHYCGTGYLDTTRIAEGGVDIWMDIVKTNRTALLDELKVFRGNLDRLIEKLEQNKFAAIEGILAEGKSSRRAFTEYGHSIDK